MMYLHCCRFPRPDVGARRCQTYRRSRFRTGVLDFDIVSSLIDGKESLRYPCYLSAVIEVETIAPASPSLPQQKYIGHHEGMLAPTGAT